MAGRHSKVHELLSREELDRLEEYAREPGRTIDECKTWLEAEGFVVSRSGVHRWMRGFLQDDRQEAATSVARQIMAVARAGKGTADIVDAASLTLAQATLDTLMSAQERGDIEPKDLRALSTTLRNATATQLGLAQLREEMEAKQREALAAAEKTAKAGGSTDQVIERVREILELKR